MHKDEYVSVGKGEGLEWVKKAMEKAYECKTSVIGPMKSDAVKVLNRIIAWHEHGLTYEVDPRHAEIIVSKLGPGDCKPLMVPARSPGRITWHMVEPMYSLLAKN